MNETSAEHTTTDAEAAFRTLDGNLRDDACGRLADTIFDYAENAAECRYPELWGGFVERANDAHWHKLGYDWCEHPWHDAEGAFRLIVGRHEWLRFNPLSNRAGYERIYGHLAVACGGDIDKLRLYYDYCGDALESSQLGRSFLASETDIVVARWREEVETNVRLYLPFVELTVREPHKELLAAHRKRVATETQKRSADSVSHLPAEYLAAASAF